MTDAAEALARTAELAALLARKRDCLARLEELGQRQLGLVDGQDVVELLKLLAEKQRQIDELHALERLLDAYRGEDPRRRQWRSEDERARSLELLQQCDAMYRRILEQEKQSESRLQRRRDDAARRLDAAHVAQFARNAYAADGSYGALDVASEG